MIFLKCLTKVTRKAFNLVFFETTEVGIIGIFVQLQIEKKLEIVANTNVTGK